MHIPESERIEYIKQFKKLNQGLINSLNIKDLKGLVLQFTEDELKCKLLLTLYSVSHDSRFLGYTEDFIDVLNDDFYKMKLREAHNDSEYDDFEQIVPNFMESNNKYKEIISNTERMNSDEEIYNYISSIDDKDIKTLFFYKTEDLSKRKLIVDSIEEDISEDIQEYVCMAQNMIFDYFENNSNGQFTEKEKLELEMVFFRTKVMYTEDYVDFCTNGMMNYKNYTLTIKETLKNKPEQMMMSLLHEYGHTISMKKFKTADYKSGSQTIIEEGMADTFADLVARSYYVRHGNINICGEDINLENATMLKYSGYKHHNNVVRTMLYPLEESGIDKEAIFSYYFDDKLRFFELTLGQEYIKGLPEDFNKNPNYNDFRFDDIYNNSKNGYRTINKDSIYAINNPKLDEFSDRYNRESNEISDSVQTADKQDEEKVEEVVDYYEKYNISPEDDWKAIKLKLSKEQRKWMKRQSTTPEMEDLVDIEKNLLGIDQALEIFNPKNEGMRENYDAMLKRMHQAKSQFENNEENTLQPEIVEKSGMRLREHRAVGRNKSGKNILSNIAGAIKNKPVSLAHLKELQQEISNQVKYKNRLQQKHTTRESKLPDNIDI